MGATKIINVLKDDSLEEILDIVKNTDASEVVFVLPKKTRAFKSEGHFVVLADEARDSGKSISFLCSNPEVNELAKKYNFDVLSTKTDKPKDKKPRDLVKIRTSPVMVPVVAKNDDVSVDNEYTEDEAASEGDNESRPNFGQEIDQDKPEEEILDKPFDNTQSKEGDEEYKEEAGEEKAEYEAPYGTEMDESGDPIYDEEEGIGEVITTSVKTRGMSDVIKPSVGKYVKIVQKDKRPIEIETHSKDRDIQSVFSKRPGYKEGMTRNQDSVAESDLGWGNESSDSIWADISKPRPLASGFKPSFLDKFKFSGKYRPQKGLEFRANKFLKRGVVGLSIISILILASIIFLTAGSARIEIKPRSQMISAQLKVAISPNFPSVDNTFNHIPGQLFTINKSASDEFNATAEKDAVQKSRGTITIYNEYSTSPQPLVATTRFEYIQDEKESGFIFRTLQSIIVPGMKVENGVVTPGKINVEIIADKAGQIYNISAGDFGIMAWREKGDTARYEKIYGRSTAPTHGGIFGKAKVVSEFDYNNAKDNLTTKVKNEISEVIKTQSAGLEIFSNIEPGIDSVESTAEIDDAADTFTITVKGSIITIGYKKEDLMALIADYVEKTNGLMIVPDKLELSYKNVALNQANNTFEVVVTISGQGYAMIDKENIATNLIGKNKAQFKDYLGSIKDIDSAKIILSPPWVKKIPKNDKKIDILLTY